MENQPNVNASSSEKSTQFQEPGRGTLILIFGILSIILLWPFLGIPAWVMGNKDLKKIKDGIISITEKTTTKIGMILGIIGTFFSLIIFGIAVVVGINIFSASAIQANRDALIADCANLAAMSQQYYRKPVVLGGGGNSFVGFEINRNLRETANGTYSLENVEPASLTIVGLGKEIGNDGTNHIKVLIKILPDRTETNIIN